MKIIISWIVALILIAYAAIRLFTLSDAEYRNFHWDIAVTLGIGVLMVLGLFILFDIEDEAFENADDYY